MERLPYQPSFLAVRDPEVNRALYELYQTIAIAVNQISDSGEQVRRTGIQVVASPGVGPQGPVGPPGPAGGGGVGTKLWGWDRATINDFTLFASGGAFVIGNVTAINTADSDTTASTGTCVPNLTFFNPAASAAVVRFMLLSNVSLSPATGELLLIAMDYASLTAAAVAQGIVIAKPGSETTDFYALQYYTGAANLYKFVANVSFAQQSGWGATSGHMNPYWKSFRILFNSSGATIGGIPAGGIEVYMGTAPFWHKTMTVGSATVLSGAVRVGFFLPGHLTLKTYQNLCCRIDAYSVPANYNQFLG